MTFSMDDCKMTEGIIFTALCFSNGAVMPSLDVRLSVCLSVRDVGDS